MKQRSLEVNEGYVTDFDFSRKTWETLMLISQDTEYEKFQRVELHGISVYYNNVLAESLLLSIPLHEEHFFILFCLSSSSEKTEMFSVLTDEGKITFYQIQSAEPGLNVRHPKTAVISLEVPVHDKTH